MKQETQTMYSVRQYGSAASFLNFATGQSTAYNKLVAFVNRVFRKASEEPSAAALPHEERDLEPGRRAA